MKNPELLFQLWTGGPLTENFKNQILSIARYMILSETKSHSLKTSESDGFVETQFLTANIGTFSGIRFHAKVEYEIHSVEVFFILTGSERLLKELHDPGIELMSSSPVPFDFESAFPEFHGKKES